MLTRNLALAGIWMAMTELSATQLIIGFALGYFVLWFSPGLAHRSNYFRRVGQGLRFTGFFLRELAIATARVAHDVLTPTPYMKPSVLGIPLDAETDAEIAMLAIVVTLTPGTLALDISSDRKTLYIHAMYVSDPEATRREIKQGFERRILELLR
ncbi:Na+/H+ antiporter subunit E [Hyalangium gracile]|uniref:Na+/H+ antiporter subunit E n=1 Tax=Hyalangium gracile TaxID=394092 RepID=UPI001CC9E470|nr:Na+/H+ antiporter subunit E [Hyalangium gracile]